MTLSTLLNAQNAAGLDQNGAIGAALLRVGGPQVLSNSGNSGSAAVTATVSNLGGLTTSDYYLGYDGSNWSLLDTASGAAAPLTASTSGGVTTLTGAGMSPQRHGHGQGGGSVPGRAHRRRSCRPGSADHRSHQDRRRRRLGEYASTANSGSARIVNAAVPSTATWTRGNYTISFFTSPTAYTVTGAGGATVTTGAYTAGTPIAFNGIAVTLSGTPATGDGFAINDNADGTGITATRCSWPPSSIATS